MKVHDKKSPATEKKGKAQNSLRKNSSLISRISAQYTNMLASWLAISLVIIFVLLLAFRVFSVVYEIMPYYEQFASLRDAQSFAERVNAVHDAAFILVDSSNTIIASSFPAVQSVTDTSLLGLELINSRLYFTYTHDYVLSDASLYALIAYIDITFHLLELAIIGGAAILLFIISMLTIYVRGNYLTRKAFGVFDELIEKASNISSQNLNLRLNVSDSTDELVEFALTFNRMMDRLEKAYEKQNQFVSDASHELRTPIAVIQGYARMLERWGKDDPEILQEAIGAINKESKGMQDLVDKLLFIARNDKDTLVLVKDKFDMSQLMSELVRDTRMLETKHTIHSVITPNVVINGDRDRIKQALRIFVDNALKYTEPTGTITLRLEIDNGFAVASVKDTGIGIPEKDLPNIFDRFYQVDNARERHNGGHGLGLSIARIIVLRHGGRIKVASKVGEGTRFSIYLPLETQQGDGKEVKK